MVVTERRKEEWELGIVQWKVSQGKGKGRMKEVLGEVSDEMEVSKCERKEEWLASIEEKRMKPTIRQMKYISKRFSVTVHTRFSLL